MERQIRFVLSLARNRRRPSGAKMNQRGEFASLLLKWRTKHGWNREESAAKLDVPHRTLQEWEQGRRLPSKMAQRGVVSRMEEIDTKQK
jgi:ribosome-binding protein aMBF1 (putative translation factor)